MLFFSKLLYIPGPKELGKSTGNYLPIRGLTSSPKDYTWEDYNEDIARMYPIKNFLVNTAPDFFRHKIISPLKDLYTFVIVHIIPSRRYHMLDLRQPKTNKSVDQYRYGWLDADSQMLFAMFNILCNFVEKEQVNKYIPTEEECNDEPANRVQRDYQLEILELHKWWTIDRKKDHDIIDSLQSDYFDSRNLRKIKKITRDKMWENLNKKQDAYDVKETEMMIRLIKVRKSMWT